jgi:hypothetical protein
MTLHTVLFLVAAICFALAAFGVSTGRVSIGWLGLLAWVLTNLI